MDNCPGATVRRLVTPRAARLLAECRELLRKGMNPVLRDFIDQLDDAFFERAHEATAERRFFTAMRELRLRRPRLQRAFHAHLDGELEAALGTRSARRGGAQPALLPRPRPYDGPAEAHAVTALVARLERESGDELERFERRVGRLLSDPTLAMHRNPFGPAAVGDAVRAMAGALSLDSDLKLTLLAIFTDAAAPAIASQYAVLSGHLAWPHVPAARCPAQEHRSPRTTDPAATADSGAGIPVIPRRPPMTRRP